MLSIVFIRCFQNFIFSVTCGWLIPPPPLVFTIFVSLLFYSLSPPLFNFKFLGMSFSALWGNVYFTVTCLRMINTILAAYGGKGVCF